MAAPWRLLGIVSLTFLPRSQEVRGAAAKFLREFDAGPTRYKLHRGFCLAALDRPAIRGPVTLMEGELQMGGKKVGDIKGAKEHPPTVFGGAETWASRRRRGGGVGERRHLYGSYENRTRRSTRSRSGHPSASNLP